MTKRRTDAVAGSERPPSRTPGREAVAIDEVQWKKWTTRGPVGVRPRVVDVSRVASAPIEPRAAFVLQLIEGGGGMLTMSDLVDVSGFAEEEVAAIVASLTRLGIVAT